jgi:hypothetical protein
MIVSLRLGCRKRVCMINLRQWSPCCYLAYSRLEESDEGEADPLVLR